MRVDEEKIAPAPWDLKGDGYICFLRNINAVTNAQHFIPKHLQNQFQPNSHPLMIFADYSHSPVGPYYELLFIPGRFAIENKGSLLSISRIFVSSMSSVINGQRNWGIPKEFAQFDISHNKHGIDRVIISQNNHDLISLSFTSWTFAIPFSTNWLPRNFSTFIQKTDDTHYFFRPKAKGWLSPARLTEASMDSNEFPLIKPENVLQTVKISDFNMSFPKAEVVSTGYETI